MQLRPPLGIFGGTFDPIHNGHIFPVLQAAEQTQIQSIALMPNYLPAHKQAAHSSSEHRLAMVRLICQQYPIFYPESWEIDQAKVSYSVETLRAFRQRLPDTPLCFFIGSDSLCNLPGWYQWQELLNLCHFVVCRRDSESDPLQRSPYRQQVETLLAEHQTIDSADLATHLNGKIYLASTSEIAMSSTQVRSLLTTGQAVENALPRSICEYIEQHKLYRQSANF